MSMPKCVLPAHMFIVSTIIVTDIVTERNEAYMTNTAVERSGESLAGMGGCK